MSDLAQQLETLQATALAELAQATTTEDTRAWHGEYLSRKGRLTTLLSGLIELPKAERPVVGKVANEIKQALEAALQARQTAIAQEEMTRALSAEGVDVT